MKIKYILIGFGIFFLVLSAGFLYYWFQIKQVSDAKVSCKIKGNINQEGEKIYHMPGQRFYSFTIIDTKSGEKWFCSENEAKKKGWRKSKI